jgi:hypothetical protein
MLKFSDLTKSQKNFIVRTLELFPAYYNEKNLNAKQIHAAYYKLKDDRSSTGEKLGYPNWLQNKNRVGRGEYKMPWPTETELKSVSQVQVPKVKETEASKLQKIIDESPEFEVESQSDEEFMKELRDNGINV